MRNGDYRHNGKLITFVHCWHWNAPLVFPEQNDLWNERLNDNPHAAQSYISTETTKPQDYPQLNSFCIGRGPQQVLVHDRGQGYESEQARRGDSTHPRAVCWRNCSRAEQARNADFSAGCIADQRRARPSPLRGRVRRRGHQGNKLLGNHFSLKCLACRHGVKETK